MNVFQRICLAALSGACCAMQADESDRWSMRVIPLPRQLNVRGAVPAAPDDIELLPSGHDAAPVEIARRILEKFAQGTIPRPAGAKPVAVRISLHLAGEQAVQPLDYAGARLRDLPNAGQAYAITCEETNGVLALRLAANTPAGLLYAARTLAQMVLAPGVQDIPADAALEIPVLTVLDWPDIEERGFWGNIAADPGFLEWMGEYKLNLAEIGANGAGCKRLVDPAGAGVVAYDGALFDLAVSNAIEPVPFIPHFDSSSFGINSGLYKKYPGAEGRAANPKTKSTAVLDNPDLRRVYADWVKAMAAIPGVRKIDAWLSEGANFDANTLARHPDTPGHVLETRLMLEAWTAARGVNSNLMLRVMLSQGSLDHYPDILAAIPPEIGVLYYHGSWRPVCPGTYSQTREQIIIPVLEQYAARGRWLGVVPTVANLNMNSFWSCPQFVQYRLKEIQAKGLRNIMAFATPNLEVRDMNFTAMAEWAWNVKGRSPREFAKAWAFRRGFKQPDLVADWAEALGPVNWDLAASGVPGARLERAADSIRQRPAALFGAALFREIRDMEQVRDNLARCERARRLAEAIGSEALTVETLYAQGYMQLIHELGVLNELPAAGAAFSDTQQKAAAESLQRLTEAALQITAAAQKERLLLFGADAIMRGRWLDPLIQGEILAYAAVGEFAGVCPDAPDMQSRLWRKAAAWDSSIFAEKAEITAEWDVTDSLREPGRYIFLFRAQAGPPVQIKGARLLEEGRDHRRAVLSEDQHDGHTFAWHTRNPLYALELPAVQPGVKYILAAEMQGRVPRTESVLENSKGVVYVKQGEAGI